MATAGSAVSSREQKWEEFRETVQKVKGELSHKIHSLTKASKEFEEIRDGFCKKYFSEYPLESETTEQPQSGLKGEVDALEEDLKRAKSEDVTIVFVGHTSTGKSSLINALLRDDRLPTGSCTSTMCIFEVRPTDKKVWSVIDTVSGTILTEAMNKEEVKDYLDALADDKTVGEREEQNISSESVIQVNWPRHLCNLPEDIVLVDTPGLEENDECDRAVANSCKKADLIVAVIDFMSPSFKSIADVLNKKKYQFKFGVFPKWDEVIKKTKETKRQQARKKNKEGFEGSVEGDKEVYFVEAENASVAMEKTERNTGTEEFLRFERDLAERAKSVKAGKGIVLTNEAKNVASKLASSLVKFISTIDERKKNKEDRLKSLENKISIMEKDRDFLDAVHREVESLDTQIHDLLSSEEIDRLIKEFGNTMENCNSEESEDLALSAFFKGEIRVINKTLQTQILKVKAEFQKWKKALELNYGCSRNTLPFHEAGKVEEPDDCGYDSKRDPHAYITSNNLWAAVFGCSAAAAGVAAAVAIPTAGAAAAIVTALETAGVSVASKGFAAAIGSLGFGTTLGFSKLVENVGGLGVGQKIRRVIGPSQMKKGKIEHHIRTVLEELKAQFENFQRSVSEIMTQNSESILSHLEMARDGSSQEMSTLEKELQQLKIWSQKLRKITNRVQVVGKELDEVQHGLKVNASVLSDDQTENQSSVQKAVYKPYTEI